MTMTETETKTSVNVELLREAVEWAEAEWAKGYANSRWHQNYWVTYADEVKRFITQDKIWRGPKSEDCGTCYCIAGYVASKDLGVDRVQGRLEFVGETGGVVYDIGHFAAHRLGLTLPQANELFEATNTIERVRELAEKFAGQPL